MDANNPPTPLPPHVQWLAVVFALLVGGCPGAPEPVLADGDSSDGSDTSAVTDSRPDTGPSDATADSGTTSEPGTGTTTMSMVDPTDGADSSTTRDSAESTTDADMDTTTTDDGGCVPGVFGVSQFGDACFQ